MFLKFYTKSTNKARYKMQTNYFAAIDLKSFYAAVECIDRGLDMFSTPLVVCDESRGDGTIVLAVSPCLRNKGVPSRLRKYELPKDEDIIFAKPRMGRYLEVSAKFNALLLDYVGDDDLHIYSVDECFINLGPYLKMYQTSPRTLVKTILTDIYETFGLVASAGIGPNMFLAKVAMDIEAKHAPDNIATWTYADVESKLWPITPLSKLWGIASGYERKLNNLGIMCVGDLAAYPKAKLKHHFGVMGVQLWEHAHGIDQTNIREKYTPTSTSLSQGQTLFRDYTKKEAQLLIREMNDDLARRLRARKCQAAGVSISVIYADRSKKADGGSLTLMRPSTHNNELYEAIMNIYAKKIKNLPIRGLYISYTNLSEHTHYQFDLFSNHEQKLSELSLYAMIDKIKYKYGLNSLMRASSLCSASNARKRHDEIGGHAR